MVTSGMEFKADITTPEVQLNENYSVLFPARARQTNLNHVVLAEIKSHGVASLTKAPQNKLKVRSPPSKCNAVTLSSSVPSPFGSVRSPCLPACLHHHRDLFADTTEKKFPALGPVQASLRVGKCCVASVRACVHVFIPTKSAVGSLAAAK